MSTNTGDSIDKHLVTDFDRLVFCTQYVDVETYVYRGVIKHADAFTLIYILTNGDAIYATYYADSSCPRSITTRQKCVRGYNTWDIDLDIVIQLLDNDLSYSLCNIEIRFINSKLPAALSYHNLLREAYIDDTDSTSTFAWGLSNNDYIYDTLGAFEIKFQTLYLICVRWTKNAKDVLIKEIAVLQQENTCLKQQVANITEKISTAIKDLSINL